MSLWRAVLLVMISALWLAYLVYVLPFVTNVWFFLLWEILD